MALPEVVCFASHVRGLDVAVDKSARVGGVKRAGHLGQKPHGASRLDRPLRRDERAQVGAVDIAHRHVQLSVCFPGSVDRDDVRMIERCRQP
jgi:hypothetical protein